MIPHLTSGRRPERGAVLVHVAVALLGLVAFSALTIDYGIMMLARGQAQNAADAAAHAAAVSLAYDAPTDFDRARASAETAGEANGIFGVDPNITRGTGFSTDETEDISFPSSPSPTCPSNGTIDTCVRVNVYRTTAEYNEAGTGDNQPLPAFFSRLFARTTQGVRATATAHILSGNASDCLRPWAVADKWQENVRKECSGENQDPPDCNGTWVPNSTWDSSQSFDRYDGHGELDPTIPATDCGGSPCTPDLYVQGDPEVPGSGTGYSLYNADGTVRDYGTILKMKYGGQGGQSFVSPGWFLSLDLSSMCESEDCPNNTGADMYRYTIQNCVGGTLGIGDTLPVLTGNMAGPTAQGVYEATGQQPLSLWERDPDAWWDVDGCDGKGCIKDSCALQSSGCADGKFYSQSPRIVPIAIFDVDAYLDAGYTGSNGEVTIVNLLGFFILGRQEAIDLGMTDGQGNTNDEVYGVMVTYPGLITNNETTTSSFLQTIVLAR